MIREEYLKDVNVADFVQFLSAELENPSLAHRYSLADRESVLFKGLADALGKYQWRFSITFPGGEKLEGDSYAHSTTALTRLAAGLCASLSTEDESDQVVCDWACAVMKWGGVTNGNVAWLKENMSGLAQEIQQVQAILEGQDDSPDKLKPIRRFNAGMTKVYSLLVDDFIIYDSRVAAALAWFILKWCQKNNIEQVPDLLAFPCMPAKEGENPKVRKCRNPSNGSLNFPAMNNNPRRHAQWNMRTSWILTACLNQSSGTVFHPVDGGGLRALEAALFMWGYDLGCVEPPHKEKLKQNNADETESQQDETEGLDQAPPEGWKLGVTYGGKARKFLWTSDPERDAIVIRRPDLPEDIFSITEIFELLHRLYDQFGYDWIRLANNVQTLNDGTEMDGLGSTIYGMVKNETHAQATSQLGPILVHYRLFEWNQRQRGIAFRLKNEPPCSIDTLRMVLAA